MACCPACFRYAKRRLETLQGLGLEGFVKAQQRIDLVPLPAAGMIGMHGDGAVALRFQTAGKRRKLL